MWSEMDQVRPSLTPQSPQIPGPGKPAIHEVTHGAMRAEILSKPSLPLAGQARITPDYRHPGHEPTLLSLALMQTWLWVYSLLKVCMRSRKHCRWRTHG